MSPDKLVSHIFRHEYGLLVATLIRRFGSQHIDAVEDAVQYALMQALHFWLRQGQPDDPAAWLYQVAYRKLLSDLRNMQRRAQILAEQPEQEVESFAVDVPFQGEMTDSLLRMLFVACNDAIPTESQLVFTLKSLCGFSIKEIAQRLFINEANVYQRYSRARRYLEKQVLPIDELPDAEITVRLPMVHQVLYLVFTEGHLSSHCDFAIREDLCQEAIRLTTLLSQSTLGKQPETYALLALMYLHMSRMSARLDDFGTLILLDEQDRSQWDRRLIATGLDYLQQSASGERVTRYHIEAGIAAEHCLSPSFRQTRWDRIVDAYELLACTTASPLIHLNKAVAIAEWQGPKTGLQVLQSLDLPAWLEQSYHWYAVQADLLLRCGESVQALESAQKALELAPTFRIKQLIYRRLEKCGLERPGADD